MATFTSAFLGEVQHPKNTLHEYLTTFGNKCQADILTWLDSWTRTKRSQNKEDWIWLVTSKLAIELGYCRDTIIRHLDKLLSLGVIERKKALRWCCDRAYEYRIVPENLNKLLGVVENQTIDSPVSDRPQSDISSSIVQNPTIYIDTSITHSQLPYPTKNSAVVVEKEVMEKEENDHPDDDLITKDSSTPATTEEPTHPEPTIEEVREIEIELRKLPVSGGFSINKTIRAQIKKNFHRAKSTVAQMGIAVRTWKVRPDYNWQGQCVAFLKGETNEELPLPDLTPKHWPEPNAEQLEQLRASGQKLDWVATPDNVGGFQQVLYVIRPCKPLIAWWEFLGISLEPE